MPVPRNQTREATPAVIPVGALLMNSCDSVTMPAVVIEAIELSSRVPFLGRAVGERAVRDHLRAIHRVTQSGERVLRTRMTTQSAYFVRSTAINTCWSVTP